MGLNENQLHVYCCCTLWQLPPQYPVKVVSSVLQERYTMIMNNVCYHWLRKQFINFVKIILLQNMDLVHVFLVCPLDKLLSWFSTQTSVVNFRYYLFCLCNVRRQYLLPGILGIYCFLTGVPSLPAIALPKGRICSLVNQVYTSFPLMSLPPFGLH